MFRPLTRRDWVRLAGASAAAGLLGPGFAQSPAPGCIVRPRQTEGPYFLDERLRRSDLRTDPADGSVKPGVPLELTFLVARLTAGACVPLAGAVVDLWQCDARGEYSGFRDIGGLYDTRGSGFLRGYQLTDAGGSARFTTIYPGWYPGRAVHIHFKVRTDPARDRGGEHTSQLYFDEATTDAVYTQPPYASRTGARTPNSADWLFSRGGGRELLLDLTPRASGYAATFALALQS